MLSWTKLGNVPLRWSPPSLLVASLPLWNLSPLPLAKWPFATASTWQKNLCGASTRVGLRTKFPDAHEAARTRHRLIPSRFKRLPAFLPISNTAIWEFPVFLRLTRGRYRHIVRGYKGSDAKLGSTVHSLQIRIHALAYRRYEDAELYVPCET